VNNILLLIALLILLVCSAFFSGSETSMMSLNRYRLRHLAKHRHRAAKRAQHLLKRTDRLLGVILIGNTFANILSSSLATLLAAKLFGDLGVIIVTITLTLIILIFGEVIPKTYAALHPESCAFPASWPLQVLLKAMYPLVWLVNGISNGILKLCGVQLHAKHADPLSAEELRTVVHASSGKLPGEHRNMLLGVLDLEHVTMADVMVPRHNITGIDLSKDWKTTLHMIKHSPYSRLPVYKDSIDNIMGVLSLRKTIGLVENASIIQVIEKLLSPPYFIPETTSLQKQLFNFQKNAEKLALVVDEYGSIRGLVTVEDILEEIVGEFNDLAQPSSKQGIKRFLDGSHLVDAEMTVRDINRHLHLHLPVEGPKTLSGLIIEYLEAIPTPKTSMLIQGYPIEIVEVEDNSVKTARIHPKLEHHIHLDTE
jgi:Mg2+/Co2+ transporter CorB